LRGEGDKAGDKRTSRETQARKWENAILKEGTKKIVTGEGDDCLIEIKRERKGEAVDCRKREERRCWSPGLPQEKKGRIARRKVI